MDFLPGGIRHRPNGALGGTQYPVTGGDDAGADSGQPGKASGGRAVGPNLEADTGQVLLQFLFELRGVHGAGWMDHCGARISGAEAGGGSRVNGAALWRERSGLCIR